MIRLEIKKFAQNYKDFYNELIEYANQYIKNEERCKLIATGIILESIKNKNYLALKGKKRKKMFSQ
ncbi:hypothetical protein [Flavivirga jejuensis]|uniref:Uncharacterized protein n=1 Tax=Flavivirga jejuensis TaxID=870487 RepID=A0ABT8WRE7_9FLAO|nr:hypothetical protein [Flavivirga jejuensis]MDO5975725.1 hypothetical protein [Flavivirga jejuensis]